MNRARRPAGRLVNWSLVGPLLANAALIATLAYGAWRIVADVVRTW